MDAGESHSKLRGAIRFCAVAMAAVALYILFLSGPLDKWRILVAVVMLVCPAVAIWVAWKYGRGNPYRW